MATKATQENLKAGAMSEAKEVRPPVKLTDISVTFGQPGTETLALRNINIELKDGELVVFIGRSGSGKTTALNVISGLVPISHGKVEVLGGNPVQARHSLGYMFARDALLPWRTARGNVEFALELRGVPKAERGRRSLEYLEMVHLGSMAKRFPIQLSQGQRQRVALARTWAVEPELILMDEPFAAVDAQTRENLQSEFIRLWVLSRRSAIFVTHDLHEALLMADRILVFKDGEVVADRSVKLERPRTIEEILSDAETAELLQELRAYL